MTIRRVSPSEALELIANQGYIYLDVRSVPEFETGHPAGAYNIPLKHKAEGRMVPNHEFLAIAERCFPKDTPLVVGCRAGTRSLQAAALLKTAGFREVVDQRCGFEGAPSHRSRHMESGWQACGLPVATQAEQGHAFDCLRKRGGGLRD